VAKRKHQRFEELTTFPNVFEPQFEDYFQKDFTLKGKWHQKFFKNDHPITLELGCGKGEYTVELAKKYPYRNFIGIDIKGARMWKGAKESNEAGLNNVAFIRTRIEFIQAFFGINEVQEIWITFPDPQLKSRRSKKRLTSSGFLMAYRNFLHPTGIIHLKTDNAKLYEYTYDLISKNQFELLMFTNDLYHSIFADKCENIYTFYEKQFLAQQIPIKYLQFKLADHVPYKEPEERE
jgi:tRNA (guanine-N7-)-methyltransferase